MGQLNGKVAVITGSTSGMGRATAYLFAKEGAKIVVTGRNEERAKAVVDKITADGGQAIYLVADTSKLSAVDEIYEQTMKAYGTVDILMNNAGQLSITPIQQMTLEEWSSVFNVNVNSAMLLTQKFAPELKKNHGHVINVASVAGCSAIWGPIAYTTSKHAMMGLTKGMARELGPEIHVNGICPGAIRTAMLDSAGGEAAMGGMIERSPLHRIGEANEIATVALFLATDASSFIDGQLIRVDGGVDC